MSARDPSVDRVDQLLWSLCVLCFVAIVWGSLAAPSEPLLSFPYSDKVLHFSSYFAFSGVFLLAAVWRPGRGTGPYPTSGRVVLGSVVVLGGLLEIVQGAWLERTSDIVDALANLAGAGGAHQLWRILQWETRG